MTSFYCYFGDRYLEKNDKALMAEQGPEGLDWPVATTKMLNRTIPFDDHSAILFVREGTKAYAENDSELGDERTAVNPQERLSGTEAKQFYEDVISMPEQSAKGEVKAGRKRKTKHRRLRANERSKTVHRVPADVSVSQVFHYVQDGDLDRVQFVLSSGTCDINAVDHFDWTLLMSAAHAGHMHIAEYLLMSGARWREYVDKSGRNAADLARVAGHLSIACFIEAYSDTVVETLESGSDARDSRDSGHNLRSKSLRRRSTYYCDTCKQNVTDSFTERHTTSTIHQFSCQHKPNVHGYTIPQTNRGYQMMLRGGWDPSKGLGCEEEGQKYPVKTVLKRDRLGFGQAPQETLQGRARVTHFAAFDERAVRRRSDRFEKTLVLRKKDIVKAARKDRDWEVRMRRYMNSEYGYGSFS